MAVVGLVAIAAIVLLPIGRENPLPRLILSTVLTPERVMTSLGFGVALSLVSARSIAVAFILFGIGIFVGMGAEDQLLRLLDKVPQAATHFFMTSPIAYLAIGAALASGSRLRPWLVPVAGLIFGAMLAFMIKLTDPSLHEPAFTWTPVLVTVWIIVAIWLTLIAFWHDWFSVFGRILGSWLLAIGLLYGGASLVQKRELPPPSTKSESTIPGMPAPDRSTVSPFRQP